jgi:hypothetical protein
MQEPSRPATPPDELPAELVEAVFDHVLEPAAITNSFRYTEQELSWLNDAIYEVTRRHRVRLSKQDIARFGLNIVLWDYRLRGDASLLGELVKRKGRQRKT